MARRLKMTFAKIFLSTNTKNWVNHLNRVVANYNKSDHKSLNNISPNDVDASDENAQMIRDINFAKKANKASVKVIHKNVKIGDKVRIKINKTFGKSSEPQFSDDVYIIEDIEGQSVVLSNGKIKKMDNLLIVPQNAESRKTPNVIEEVNKKARIKRRLNKEGI